MNHQDKLADILSQYPEFEKLSEETEKLRDKVDQYERKYESPALKAMIDIDTNMIRLMRYHIELSTVCLKNIMVGSAYEPI